MCVIPCSRFPVQRQDPFSPYAGTGGPEDGSFTNLATDQPEKRFNGGNIQDGFWPARPFGCIHDVVVPDFGWCCMIHKIQVPSGN